MDLMTFMVGAQGVLAVALGVFILLQQRGAGLGSLAGGASESVQFERRGGEKFVFRITLILAVLFALNAALLPLLG